MEEAGQLQEKEMIRAIEARVEVERERVHGGNNPEYQCRHQADLSRPAQSIFTVSPKTLVDLSV